MASEDRWRQTHLGRLLTLASHGFDVRVLSVMAHSDELALTLSNLVSRGKLTASHIQITRHLPLAGCSLTELAARAGISKQAMGKLVDQCAAWNLVHRTPEPRDARAIRIVFTPTGVQWLETYRQAVHQAEAEFDQALGLEVATVIRLGLEAYAA